MSNMSIPMSVWPAVVVIAIIGVAVSVRGCAQKIDVAVPVRDLPALHQITAADLTSITMKERDAGAKELRTASDLVGRVTRTKLSQKARVMNDAVTKVTGANYAQRSPVAFHVDSSTAGEPESGDEITLAFAPTADAKGTSPVVLSALLIEAKEIEAGGTDYVVAVSRKDRQRLLNVVARSRLLVSLR